MSDPLSVSESAHAVFLSRQPALHPVLQQLQELRQTFADPVVIQSSSARSDVADVVLDRVQPPTAHNDDEHEQNETISAEIFSGYRHREILPGCQPHPGDIVEAGPLAAITPPDTYYPLEESLPGEIISSGKLSSLQLEGVIQACQRHQMVLPSGQRAGFFIGDAAGVGKGRQIAGVILDNYARGRTKAVWFTISTDLIVDTKRDLGDLGCYIKVIDGCQELDKHTRVLGLPSDFKEGVVFSTYATLVSSVQRGGSGRTRLQQLVDWCGGEQFDGCLIFDECHKAKNFVPGKEQASTKVALAVTSIQRMLPKARVLYCSATGVTDVKNMAFMERLGLWGEGAPYNNFEQFLVSVQKKGLGMAEILAMEMKSAGMYVSRGLSYKQAEFITVEASLSKEQRKVYDTAVHVWNELRKALESAVVRTASSNTRVWQQFWSCHQRFFKQLCLGMKVPTIISEAKKAMDRGQCIVIGLQTTGEASLDSELDKTRGKLTGFMSLCREILYRFIESAFPTRIVPTKEGDVAEDEWSVTAKNMLLDFTKKINLPDSPLDEIIDKLGGPSNVAEMTGRKGRIVRHSPNDTPRYETRTLDSEAYGAIDSLNVQERNMFMEGKKLVAIISDAASTGISLHADLRVANQCRRVHLTVELPWSADKAVQQLGRSHRSNQSSGPLYKLLTTDLGGERRFAAAVARRLQSLGALTKGDRRAATGADLAEFNFDTQYGRNALRTMYHHICQKKLVPGVSLTDITGGKYDEEVFSLHMQESLVLMGLVDVAMLRSGLVLKEKDTGDVSKFLNRILGLHVDKQNMIFTYFTECMKLMIDNAKKEGRYSEGMLDISASSVEMVGTPREIFTKFNKGHTSTRLVELMIDRGMSWDQAVARADNYSGKHDGFYVSRREVWGKKLYILATQKENSTHLFRIARPNTGLSYMDEEKSDLNLRYVLVDRAKAEAGWRELYEATRDSCVHGAHCKNRDFCKVGSRCYSLHLLCGSIVTYMNALEATLNRNALKLNLSKTESSIRVVRVKLNDGERVVGVRYPQILISEVEETLREQNALEAVQLQQQRNMTNGDQLPSSQSSLVTQGLWPLSQPASRLADLLTQPTNQTGPSAGSSEVVVTGRKTVVEDVTPVKPKCLAKALRPPVTIKNFFKTTETSVNISKQPESGDCDDLNSSGSGASKEPISGENLVKPKSVREISYQEFLNRNDSDSVIDKSNLGSVINKCKLNVYKAADGEESENKKLVIATCITGASGVGETKEEKMRVNQVNSVQKKRPLEEKSSSQPPKKAKQTTLFSTFQKMESKKSVEAMREITCPICQKVFDKGISNTDLNEHIDNCIIE
ncbi:hypothetical protein DPMN_140752 [Dreissena polymorpha]|uniref:Uncharacterized protein n=2 Tax=Dreissena polymorpha TaxID=45954 RepID=A0A9D4GBH3_DREPO|nr:hypothetical protein DPMN_140752 [Dreissena polymorpha]